MKNADGDLDYNFILNSQNILCIGGTDGLVKLVNPRFIEITGWKEEELLGKSFLDLLHPDELERTKVAIATMADTTSPIHVESKIRCKDDSYRWFSWNVTKKGAYFYGLATDITQQKEKEEELVQNKQSQIDYQKILESVFDQIVITDPEGVILFVNGAVEAITGFSKGEILGTKAGKHWGGYMDHEFYERLWKTIKGDKEAFMGKITNKRKTGELYEAEIRIIPVLTEDKEIQYFVGVERDISKEAELAKLTDIVITREVRMAELKGEIEKMKDQNSR